MSLHNGLDHVAIVTAGVYTKTYGSTNKANIANLYASFGFLEDAPTLILIPLKNVVKIVGSAFKKLIGG